MGKLRKPGPDSTGVPLEQTNVSGVRRALPGIRTESGRDKFGRTERVRRRRKVGGGGRSRARIERGGARGRGRRDPAGEVLCRGDGDSQRRRRTRIGLNPGTEKKNPKK